MIETVRFQNYKGFEDVEVKLERLTVFVGPNASGKTSMPRGIESISQTKEVSPDTYFSTEFDNYPYYSYRRGAKSDMVLSWTEPDMEVRVTVVPPDDYESADVLRWDVYMEDWKVKVKSRNLPDGEWIEVFASYDKQNNGSSTPPLSLMLRLEGARLAAPSVV